MTPAKNANSTMRTFELENRSVQKLRLAPHKSEQKPPFFLEDENAAVGSDGFTDSQRQVVVDRIINRLKKI